MMLHSSAAICTSPCQNGGTCTAPDTCSCDVRWTGMQCETGTYRTETGIGKFRLMALPHNSPLNCCCCIPPATDCGDPGTPTNGQRSLSSTTYNSVVTYSCDVGYTLQGSNSRTCQSDGQWSGSVPQCPGIHIVYMQYVCFVQCSIWKSIMHYDTVLYCTSGYSYLHQPMPK